MFKSSSLCLYSSNLGTFWLKIEQFWPFEEISIFSNGKIFSSETTGPIAAKLLWNDPWMAPFQNCVR
jgi:hypothetical protein